MIAAGNQHPEVVLHEPTPQTNYMFCYTSGTTGDPKGAMITNETILSCMHSLAPFELELNEEDSVLSYMPYGHVSE